MKYTKKIGTAAAAGVLLATMCGGTAAFAAVGDPITVEPGQVASGEEFTVSGADCVGPGAEVSITAFAPDGTAVPGSAEVTPEEDGTWATGAAITAEDGEYSLLAQCTDYSGETYDYAGATITIATPADADADADGGDSADANGGADGGDSADANGGANAGAEANGGSNGGGDLANTGSESSSGMMALGVAGVAAVAGAALLLARRRTAAE